MCHEKTPGIFESELIGLIKNRRGQLASICNIEQLPYQRIVNTMSKAQGHQMTPDEFLALIRGGCELGLKTVRSLRTRVIQSLHDEREATPSSRNGQWVDEAHRALQEIANALAEHPDANTSDLSTSEISDITNRAYRVIAEMEGLLAELDVQRNEGR